MDRGRYSVMNPQWPSNWDQLVQGIGCEMCESARPESDSYGVRIRATKNTDAVLQRANLQRGYTLGIWRGGHVTEPTKLTDEEACIDWPETLTAGRAHISPLRHI